MFNDWTFLRSHHVFCPNLCFFSPINKNKKKSCSFLVVSVQILPSPTTGSFAAQAANWKNHQQSVKQEDKNFSDFSFQTQTRPPASSSSSSIFQSSNTSAEHVSKSSHYSHLQICLKISDLICSNCCLLVTKKTDMD